MGLRASDPSLHKTPAPEGLHQAVCVDVQDLGNVETPWGLSHQCLISWQLDLVNPESGRRFLISSRYKVSLHAKASLRQDIESWRGKLSKAELADFDVDSLIGLNCQLNVIHKPNDEGQVFANVASIVPLGKGMTPIAPMDYVRAQDRPVKDTRTSKAA